MHNKDCHNLCTSSRITLLWSSHQGGWDGLVIQQARKMWNAYKVLMKKP